MTQTLSRPTTRLLTAAEPIVEVRCKNDTETEVSDKVAAYLTAGARLVWVADLRQRTISAHRPNQPPVILSSGDTLTADEIIPDFAVPVDEFFKGVL
jgi:Uma2 family endonuclease